jgi:signal transduction histidine kinase
VESGKSDHPIVITIAAEPDEYGGDDRVGPASTLGDDAAPGVTIRIRDRGGGIPPAVLPNIWSYSFTTFEDESLDDFPGGGGMAQGAMYPGSGGGGGMEALDSIAGAGGLNSSIAGLGYGLPLSRAYAEYFGGGIAVQSLYGWGCDVYLRLKGIW